MATRKGGPGIAGSDPAFTARNTDFAARWAARLERDTPIPAKSVLHRHTDACWIGERRTVYANGVWMEGRNCRVAGFVAERYVSNPSAVR